MTDDTIPASPRRDQNSTQPGDNQAPVEETRLHVFDSQTEKTIVSRPVSEADSSIDPASLEITQISSPAPKEVLGAAPAEMETRQVERLPEAERLPEVVRPPRAEQQPQEAIQSQMPVEEDIDIDIEAQRPPRPKRRLTWLLWAFLSILVLALIAASSAYSGYLSAIDQRISKEATQIAGEAQVQYEMGMEDLAAGRYDLARQRFEYVIRLNPGYPSAADMLAEALLRSISTATVTPAPTPTVTPTPDLRGQDDLFIQAQSYMLTQEWGNVIDTLLLLRKRDPEYRVVEVDGMLYMALRNQGVDKISRQADLEGGTYNLALAERFGPLDVEAKNWKDWAELYTRGASFWDVDWEQAVYHFSQLVQIAPNLMDASQVTAMERYRRALVGYGDWLARQARWCEAQEQYQAAINVGANPSVQPTAEYSAQECSGSSQPSEGTIPGGEATPTFEVPVATFEPPPTVDPTAYP